jgi:hypothetical protein
VLCGGKYHRRERTTASDIIVQGGSRYNTQNEKEVEPNPKGKQQDNKNGKKTTW